ncbi:hypothetical protein L218DRAFT_925228 [Marasmius fiardii PR-910]|nr:hypothetical protein L218DRAFT_925228 [Marasmius fiardii PR-910]
MFISGDQLGSLKFFNQKLEQISTISSSNPTPVQKLVVSSKELTAAYGDGSIKSFSTDSLKQTHSWLQSIDRFIGLASSNQGVFSCTSSGALRLHSEHSTSASHLPTRLHDWRLSPSTQNFAYGGDQVDLSIWDVERAFSTPVQPPTSTKKRKRSQIQLFPAETWRAKNVPNDSLGLRQPIRITSLTYVSPSDSDILTGTELGHLRRYDTRSARKPVADWNFKDKGATPGAGIRLVHASPQCENQAFIADTSSNLLSIDLRTGGVVYGYKGIAGSVTSLTFAGGGIMASTSQDRYIRLHTTPLPPSEPRGQQPERGQIIDKVYMKSVPTVVVWDPSSVNAAKDVEKESEGGEDEDVEGDDDPEDLWEGMEEIGDEQGESKRARRS